MFKQKHTTSYKLLRNNTDKLNNRRLMFITHSMQNSKIKMEKEQ